MKLKDSDLDSALGLGLAHTSVLERAKAENCRLEQGVSSTRQDYFETFAPSKVAPNWDAFQKLHVDYVKRYVETNDEQPHTFLDVLQPNGIGSIDEKQTIVRLENLTRPMNAFGCSYAEFKAAHEAGDTDFLSEFCDVWNDNRDYRPAFSTLLSELTDIIDEDDWAERLRDFLGLAHYPTGPAAEPVVLCKYSVEDVSREATSSHPITMPTVLDSRPWEHYFPAPKSLQFGRAMALTPCEGDEDLKIEFLNQRVTYSPSNIWKVGQIVTPAPNFDISELRERHLLALQFAADDLTFGT